MADKLAARDDDALIVVDVQNDFVRAARWRCRAAKRSCSGQPAERVFAQVALTQDWHPRGHASFASSHPAPSCST